MASKYTENYGLCQWEATDQVLRTEFNEDNQKVDTALNKLSAQMETKADQTTLNTLSAAVLKKADQSALTAVASTIPKIVVGSYTGNGAQSRTISVGFTPKAVFVNTSYGAAYTLHSNHFYYGGLAVQGKPLKWDSSDYPMSFLSIVDGGFSVTFQSAYGHNSMTNAPDVELYYLAIG